MQRCRPTNTRAHGPATVADRHYLLSVGLELVPGDDVLMILHVEFDASSPIGVACLQRARVREEKGVDARVDDDATMDVDGQLCFECTRRAFEALSVFVEIVETSLHEPSTGGIVDVRVLDMTDGRHASALSNHGDDAGRPTVGARRVRAVDVTSHVRRHVGAPQGSLAVEHAALVREHGQLSHGGVVDGHVARRQWTHVLVPRRFEC